MGVARPTMLVVVAAGAVVAFAWWIMQPPPGFTAAFPARGPQEEPVSAQVVSRQEAIPHRVAGFEEPPERLERPWWVEDDSPPTRAAVGRQVTRLEHARETLRAHRTKLGSELGRDTAAIVLDAHLAKLDRDRAILLGTEATSTPQSPSRDN